MFKQVLVLFVLAFVATAFAQERYPANVHPAACPNYPFCNVNHGPPGYHFDRSLGYPPGLNAASCPNFPFC